MQKAALTALGCDILQGYLIAPPLEEAAFRDYLARQLAPALGGLV